MPNARQAGWLRRCLAAGAAGAFVALGAAGCASNGAAKAADPARVQRLGALFVQTMPIGWIAERVAQLDPQWPMQQHAGKFTPAQLACTRGELTADKVDATVIGNAQAFARRYPDRVEESIQLLEAGAAETTGMLMRAGVREGTGGAKVDASRLMAELTAAQLRSFVTLTENPQYAELRQALRLDGITSASSRQESRQRGFRLGQSLMAAPLLSAFERCNISPAAIFDQPGMPA